MYRTPIPISFIKSKVGVVPASMTNIGVGDSNTFKLVVIISEIADHNHFFVLTPSEQLRSRESPVKKLP